MCKWHSNVTKQLSLLFTGRICDVKRPVAGLVTGWIMLAGELMGCCEGSSDLCEVRMLKQVWVLNLPERVTGAFLLLGDVSFRRTHRDRPDISTLLTGDLMDDICAGRLTDEDQ